MLVLLICAVLGAAYLLSVVWAAFFATSVPGFLVGLVGGLTSLPLWQGLKKLRDSEPKKPLRNPRR